MSKYSLGFRLSNIVKKYKGSIAIGSVMLLIVGANLVFNLNYYIGVVDGESMESTYFNYDDILVDRCRAVRRNDVITISTYGNNSKEHFIIIKRAVAIGGDKVKIRANKVYVNGLELKEGYLKEDMQTYDLDEITLKSNEIFVMGDSRNVSKDSRDEDIGIINSDKEVAGVAVYNITKHGMSADRIQIVECLVGFLLLIIAFILTNEEHCDEVKIGEKEGGSEK